MKAYRVHEYGKAAKFIKDEINKPKVKQGYVVTVSYTHLTLPTKA